MIMLFNWKHILSVLVVAIFLSCKTNKKKVIANTSDIKVTVSSDQNWDSNQDSLRNVLLARKENETIKTSFLQELYIRNVVALENDSLVFNIPFDLHGPDCGAPDCYSTDIQFSIGFNNKVSFPKTILITEHENGCIDTPITISALFKLIEATENHVIYHSALYNRTLVLFDSNKATGTSAFYFSGKGSEAVTGLNVYNINNQSATSAEFPYPFMSWILTTNEYARFLK
jgi:hypothetical protein